MSGGVPGRAREASAAGAGSQGEITVSPGRGAETVASLGPWRSIAAAGPRRRTAKGEESPKLCSARASPRSEEVPEIASDVGRK